jgi:hypothetical protein
MILQKEADEYDLDACYFLNRSIRERNFIAPDDFIFMKNTRLTELGYNDDHWIGLASEDVYVGSLDFMREVFHILEVKVVPLGIVKDLLPYYQRDIKYATLQDARKGLCDGSFIKPYVEKLFPYTVLDSLNAKICLDIHSELPGDTKIIVSAVEDFVSEYRCFIHKGKLVGVKPYTDDWHDNPPVDLSTVPAMVASWKKPPIAYTLDLGVTSEGKTKLIEVNDFWSCGCYGFEGPKLVTMTTQRFKEILRKKTTKVD